MRLYRGVSPEIHQLGQALLPKTLAPFTHTFSWGEQGLKWGSGAVWGPSKGNAILRHQLGQAGFPTSGLSTTPHPERARFYATKGGELPNGYVYELDGDALLAQGAQCFRVSDYATAPSVPEDDEHILLMEPPGAIPASAIVRIARVER